MAGFDRFMLIPLSRLFWLAGAARGSGSERAVTYFYITFAAVRPGSVKNAVPFTMRNESQVLFECDEKQHPVRIAFEFPGAAPPGGREVLHDSIEWEKIESWIEREGQPGLLEICCDAARAVTRRCFRTATDSQLPLAYAHFDASDSLVAISISNNEHSAPEL